jgi:hypothetical protein
MHGWDWDWSGEWNWYWSPAAIVGVVIGSLVVLAIGVLIWYFFLRNLRDLLNQVSDQNRFMPASHVWLNFIPVFSLGWIIYTVVKVRDSVRAEYGKRGWAPEGDFGYGVGLAFGILTIASGVFGGITNSRVGWLDGLVSLAGLVCWIIYWVTTSRLKNRLMVVGTPLGYTAPPQYPGYGGPVGPVRPAQQAPSEQGVEPQGTGEPSAPSAPIGASGTEAAPSAPAAASPEAASAEMAAQTATCPFCGTAYRSGARFCSYCGRPAS